MDNSLADELGLSNEVAKVAEQYLQRAYQAGIRSRPDADSAALCAELAQECATAIGVNGHTAAPVLVRHFSQAYEAGKRK